VEGLSKARDNDDEGERERERWKLYTRVHPDIGKYFRRFQ